MKQIEVLIMGQGYLLGCPEGGEAQLRGAVAKVDAAMCRIRDGGKVKARDRIAVLAALNLAFDAPELPQAFAVDGGAAGATALPTPQASLAPLPPLSAAQPGTDARVTALLARLDKALGSDGQLL